MSPVAATLGGTVRDPTGAAIAGAAVSIRNRETGGTWVAGTNDAGLFRFPAVPAGNYELTAECPGFATHRLHLSIRVGQALDVPIVLAVGGLADAVTVAAEAPRLEAARTQIAETIRTDEIDALPVNGRNYLDLALVAAGVSRTNTGTSQRFAETSAVPGTGISFSSQRNLNNAFLVDGLTANDDAADLAGTFYSQDVIREFQVVTSGGIAEFGRASGGIVSIVTRSGSNDLHGRGYGFFRDASLDATHPLADAKEPFHQVQAGVSLGGAIERDRVFFFGNVEHLHETRTGFLTIAPDLAAAVNRALEAWGYPGPRVETGTFSAGSEYVTVFGRTDARVGDAHRITARYNLYDIASPNARTVGGLNAVSRGTSLDNRDHVLAVMSTSMLSATSLLDVRAQGSRSRLAAPPNDPFGPAVNVSGVASFGTATSSPTARGIDAVHLTSAITSSRGAHLVKAGVDFLYNRVAIEFPGPLQGVYAFSSLASLEAGRYITFQQAFGETLQVVHNPNVGLFVQDEWRPTANLTVNAGLRYDVQRLPAPVRSDGNNVAPRFGLSWAPGNRKTVVRASAGLFFDGIPLRAVSNALQRDGTRYRTAVLAFGQPHAPAFPATLDRYPDSVLPSISTIDHGIDSARSEQASLQIERELGRGHVLSIGYQHLRGRGLIMARNVNVPTLSAAEAAARGVPNLGRPDSTVANNLRYGSLGDSWYDGLTIGWSSRWAWGQARVSYTLSKALDTAGNFFFSTPQNNFDIADEKGLSNNDQRHRIVASGTVDSPARHRAGPWGRVLGDWQLSYIVAYGSAFPFNIQTGTDRNGDTNVNDRPAGVGRNTGVGFASATVDVRLSRTLRFTRARLELLVEAFNLLNRANYQLPNNIFGPGHQPLPSFGRPTAAGDPRQVQLGFRLGF